MRTLALLASVATTLAAAAPHAGEPAPATAHSDTSSSGNSGVVVEQAWARATPPASTTAAGYLTLRNRGAAPDRLVSASSTAAARVEIHEMSMQGGTMKMRPLPDGVAVPAGGSVVLKPGGVHLMFFGTKAPFVVGTPVTVTLVFDKAGKLDVALEVLPIGAAGPPTAASSASAAPTAPGPAPAPARQP